MGRLRVLSGAEVVKILEQHGFAAVRQRGSHIAMQKRQGGTTLTAIMPAHAELRAGTLLAIARQAGLPRAIFEVE